MPHKQLMPIVVFAATAGFLGGALGAWCMSELTAHAQQQPPKLVEAQEFRLVDSRGGLRASLGLLDEGAALALYREGGERQVVIASGPDGPGQFLSDSSGHAVQFQASRSRARVILNRASATLKGSRVELGFNDGSPSLNLFDHEGRLRATIGATQLEATRDGTTIVRPESSIVLFDRDGKVVATLP